MKKHLNRAILEVKIKADSNIENLQRALSTYIDESDYASGIRNLMEKQPDLFYGVSILVSEGANKNSDVFLRSSLLDIFKSPRHKFLDYEHDETGSNASGKNPNRYKVIGHIYDSAVTMQDTGEVVPEEMITKSDLGEYFSENPEYKDRPIDIVVAWVIYKFLYPEITEQILAKSISDPDHFGVSMEILFSDYKFRIGGAVNPEESFDTDGNELGFKEVRKGELLADTFQKDWNKGKWRVYNNKPVVRVLGGEMFFSGMAITGNRANNRSWNISVGGAIEEEVQDGASAELVNLLQAVASKSESFNIETCEIEADGPSCNCLNNAISSKIDDLLTEITLMKYELTTAEYLDDVENEDDIAPSINKIHVGLEKARKKLQYLYENNIDGELSYDEIREYVEEIDHFLGESKALLEKINTGNNE